jgi:hypothetical protein
MAQRLASGYDDLFAGLSRTLCDAAELTIGFIRGRR